MHKKSLIWVMALLIAIGIGGVAYAGPAAGGWMLLGTAHVDGKADHDKIKCGDTGTFRAIQLRVSGGAVHFDRVSVRYQNGQSEDVSLKNEIPAGGKTRQIDLPGARRSIERVDMWYEKGAWGNGRPTVSLFGIR